jgi:hypothetical protein
VEVSGYAVPLRTAWHNFSPIHSPRTQGYLPHQRKTHCPTNRIGLKNLEYVKKLRSTLPSPSPGVKVGTVASPSLTVENVEVDADQSTVTVTMNYEADLKNSDLELFIDFTYLRTSLGLPHFDTTQDSDKVYTVSSYRSNSMIGQFYTQDQYASANLLNKLSLAIGLMSFFAFLIGIFTKEVVGLEMTMLCQFVYISLFYFEGTLELPFFASEESGVLHRVQHCL